MAELPYMQFFPTDWLADTRMITASTKGAWIDTIAHLWNAPTRGTMTATAAEWGRLWGVEAGEVETIISDLGKVAGIRREGFSLTIYSRRMVRDEIERERSRNAKRPEAKKDWTVRNQALVNAPELFPKDSRAFPADFPNECTTIPGDNPETRDQREKRERGERES